MGQEAPKSTTWVVHGVDEDGGGPGDEDGASADGCCAVMKPASRAGQFASQLTDTSLLNREAVDVEAA